MSQSTTAAADAALDEAGPIGYLIVRFGSGRVPGHAFHLLLELADRDLVRVLDMEFVTKDTAGAVALADPVEIVTAVGGELPAFKGASSGCSTPRTPSSADFWTRVAWPESSSTRTSGAPPCRRPFAPTVPASSRRAHSRSTT